MSTPTVTLHIPTPLRSATDDQATVEAAGATVRDAMHDLVARYPDLKSNLYTDAGELRQFVNIYVDDEDIRYLDGPDTALDDGAEVSIVPSIAGGCLR